MRRVVTAGALLAGVAFFILVLAIFLGEAPPAISVAAEESRSVEDFDEGPMPTLVQTAPGAPNESRVTGEVLELERVHSSALHIVPPQEFTRIRLRLLSTRSVGTVANPLQGREGESLEVLSREAVDSNLIGKVISGTVVYRGDERGGRYWIFEVRIGAGD